MKQLHDARGRRLLAPAALIAAALAMAAELDAGDTDWHSPAEAALTAAAQEYRRLS